MIIKTKTEREYVYKWVLIISSMYNLQPREIDVAAAMAYRYFILEKARSKFSTEQKRMEYNPMAELRKPETLKLVCADLNITFDVFRSYISKLKDKGVFVNGTLNSNFIIKSTKMVIEVWE